VHWVCSKLNAVLAAEASELDVFTLELDAFELNCVALLLGVLCIEDVLEADDLLDESVELLGEPSSLPPQALNVKAVPSKKIRKLLSIPTPQWC
jgi:hypothetical protein